MTFEDRENAFEAYFARQQELDFRSTSRRDRLLAAWTVQTLGLGAAAGEDYAASLTRARVRQPDGEAVYVKVLHDLAEAHVEIAPRELRRKMDEFAVQARRDVFEGVQSAAA
jgi:hypothetical protein